MKFTKRFSFILCPAALFLAGTLIFVRATSEETLNDKVNRILKSEEYKNSRKPSAVAREMPKQASAPSEAPVEATETPVDGAAPTIAIPKSATSVETQIDGVLTQEAKAAILAKNHFRVVDGDTFYVRDKKYRLGRVDAPELSQTYGEESRKALETALAGGKVEIIPIDTDKYGCTVADVRIDGEDLAMRLVKEGNAWHYEYDESEHSEAFRLAQQEARDAGVGLFGAQQGYQEPRAYRSSLNLSKSESNKLDNWLNYLREINGISYTPEYIKQFNDEIDAKYDKPLTEEEKKIAPVLNVSTTVASIAGRGFYYEASGKDIDDIPTYELNTVLEEIRQAFGYTAEDFTREGFDDPYDAAREYIKSAMGIVRKLERQQKEFLKLPDDEQQEQMREIYGDRWFSSEEVKQHAETMSIRGATELAFMNGAEAKTVSTAIMMALCEVHDEDMHRSRLAQMSPEQARKAEKLWKAIRPE